MQERCEWTLSGVIFIKERKPVIFIKGPAMVAVLLGMVVPMMGLQSLSLVSRLALLTSRTASRCAPVRVQHGDPPGDFWVDFDDSGGECVISESGSTCMDADVAGPLRIDDIDEGRRGRLEGRRLARAHPLQLSDAAATAAAAAARATADECEPHRPSSRLVPHRVERLGGRGRGRGRLVCLR